MALIPQQNKIYDALENRVVNNNPRGYLGYSQMGEQCIRYLQYCLRMAFTEQITVRVKRLFNFGHYMEQVFIDDLISIGCKIENRQAEVIGFAGHWKGHIDCTVVGLPGAEKTIHLGEFKTHNDANFKLLKKHEHDGGVAKSFPKHFVQANTYMGKFGYDRALYIGYNKNDSQYYVERLYFNEKEFKGAEHKEKEVLFAEGLYPRIGSGKETWHECKFCPAKQVCFGKEQPVRNCRTCEFVSIEDNGKWSCGITKKVLDEKAQAKACSKYKLEGILHV